MLKTRKIKLYSIIVLLLLGLVVSVWWVMQERTAGTSADIALVRAQELRISDGNQVYKYSGEVRGRYESHLGFRLKGKIVQRNVELGSTVKAGDLLMQIDPENAQLDLKRSAAQVNALESQFKLARDNYNRARVLYEQNVISKSNLDNAQTAYETAQAQLNSANIQYEQAGDQLQYCNLHADGPGIITGIYSEAGQLVDAGTPVLTLVRDGEREVEINVPENRIEDIRQAGKVKVSFWALPDVEVDGQVREIAPIANPIARTFKVRISLSNAPPDMKLGMTSTVTANCTTNQPAVAVIPLASIYQTGNTPSVWIVDHGVVRLREVTVADFGDNKVRISKGLKNGDVVVTAGVHKLHSGQKVRTEKSNEQ